MAIYDENGIYDKAPARLMSKDGLVSFTADGERLDALGHGTGQYTNPNDLIDMAALGLWGNQEQEKQRQDSQAAGRGTPQGEAAYQDYREGERSAGGGVSGLVGSGQGAGALGRPQAARFDNEVGTPQNRVGSSWPAAEQAMRPYRHVQLESGRTIVVATGDMSGVEVASDNKGNQYVKSDPPRWLGVARFDNERAPTRPRSGGVGDSWPAVGNAMRQAQDDGSRVPTRDNRGQAGFDFLNPGQRLPEVDGVMIRPERQRNGNAGIANPQGYPPSPFGTDLPIDRGQPFHGQPQRGQSPFNAYGDVSRAAPPPDQFFPMMGQNPSQPPAQPAQSAYQVSPVYGRVDTGVSGIPPGSPAQQLIDIGRSLGLTDAGSQFAPPAPRPVRGDSPSPVNPIFNPPLPDPTTTGYGTGLQAGVQPGILWGEFTAPVAERDMPEYGMPSAILPSSEYQAPALADFSGVDFNQYVGGPYVYDPVVNYAQGFGQSFQSAAERQRQKYQYGNP